MVPNLSCQVGITLQNFSSKFLFAIQAHFSKFVSISSFLGALLCFFGSYNLDPQHTVSYLKHSLLLGAIQYTWPEHHRVCLIHFLINGSFVYLDFSFMYIYFWQFGQTEGFNFHFPCPLTFYPIYFAFLDLLCSFARRVLSASWCFSYNNFHFFQCSKVLDSTSQTLWDHRFLGSIARGMTCIFTRLSCFSILNKKVGYVISQVDNQIYFLLVVPSFSHHHDFCLFCFIYPNTASTDISFLEDLKHLF